MKLLIARAIACLLSAAIATFVTGHVWWGIQLLNGAPPFAFLLMGAIMLLEIGAALAAPFFLLWVAKELCA